MSALTVDQKRTRKDISMQCLAMFNGGAPRNVNLRINNMSCYESSLSSVINDIFMKAVETEFLSSINLKPQCWFRNVDDTLYGY